MQNRKTFLETLLRFRDPKALKQIMTALREYGWDSEETLVNLTSDAIISILERYLQSELTAQEVEDWANAVEMRDDIEFGIDDDEVIMNAVGELANPVLTEPLTPESAMALIEKLRMSPDQQP
jgi:hypothetical protein